MAKGRAVNSSENNVFVWKAYVENGEEIETRLVYAPTERAAREKLRRRGIEWIKLKQIESIVITNEMITAVEKALEDATGISEVLRKYVMTVFD